MIKFQSNENLHLLNLLSNCFQTIFNVYERRNDVTCFQNTRKNIFNQIEIWIDECDNKCIFWLNEMIETNKFIIVRTIIRQYHEKNYFETNFFFFQKSSKFSTCEQIFFEYYYAINQTIRHIQKTYLWNCDETSKYRSTNFSRSMNTIDFSFHSQISNHFFRNRFDDCDRCFERMWKRKKCTKNDKIFRENQKLEKKSIENFYDQ